MCVMDLGPRSTIASRVLERRGESRGRKSTRDMRGRRDTCARHAFSVSAPMVNCSVCHPDGVFFSSRRTDGDGRRWRWRLTGAGDGRQGGRGTLARWGRNGGRMDRPCGACLDTRYRPRGARVPKGQDPWARGSRRNGAQNEDTLWRESRTRRRPLSGGRGGPISHQADRERSCRAEVSAKWGVENQGGEGVT